MLSYGYWIREKGRKGVGGLRESRLDLGVGYLMTALFGLAMIVTGSRVSIAKGPAVALELAGQLAMSLGPTGRWVCLLGFWGAVFSSLLGVWQSIPYLFADLILLIGRRRGNPGNGTETDNPSRTSDPFSTDSDEGVARDPLAETELYRLVLLGITVVPICLLWISVQQVQLIYAVVGAFFMPLLGFSLLIMNNRAGWVGKPFRNGWAANSALVITMLFFAYVAVREVIKISADFLGM